MESTSPCLPLPKKSPVGRSLGWGRLWRKRCCEWGLLGLDESWTRNCGKGQGGSQERVGWGLVGAWELRLEVLMPLDNR